MPHSQRRSQPGPSPLHQVLLTEEPLELEHSHGLVRDPRFWRLFSKAVHLSDGEKLESGLPTASNTADAKEGYVTETNGWRSTVTVDVSGGDTLCLENAEWVVENPADMPCPNFTEVWFAQCSATTTTGAVMGIDGTTAIHMQSSDGTLILSEWVDNTDMYVQY